MQLTIKQLSENVLKNLQQLDQKNPEVQASIQKLFLQIDAQNKRNGVAEVSDKIAEMQEELQILTLQRDLKKLQAGLDSAKVNIDPVEANFDVPESLKSVFVDVRPKDDEPKMEAVPSKPRKVKKA